MRKRNLILGFLFAILASLTLGFGNNTNAKTYAAGVVNITFNANGGECNTESMQTSESGTLDSLPSATKNGYVFVHWVYDNNPVTTETEFSEDTTITALYYLKSNNYTISKNDSHFNIIGKTQKTDYDYTLSDSCDTLSEAITLINNDLTTSSNAVTINFDNISLEENLSLNFRNLSLSGSLELNEYSINYNIPVQNSQLNFANLSLTATSSQNLINIAGSNYLTVTITDCTFTSSTSTNNYALHIDNSATSITIQNKLIYQTEYFYNHDTGTSATATNIDLSEQSNGKILITVPYYEDGKVIISSSSNSSLFEFVPLSDNYACSITSTGYYHQASITFNIRFDTNGGTLNSESLAETRVNITSPLYFPTSENLTKTHSTLNGFAGKITLSSEFMQLYNIESSIWYFDQNSLEEFLTSASGYEDIQTYFTTSIPNNSTHPFTYYAFDSSFSDINYLSSAFMLDLNITPEYIALWSDTIYKISFETNGGTSIEDITGIYGSTITIPTTNNPQTSKLGYTFEGWYTSNSFELETYIEDNSITTMPDTNPTFYAKWSANNQSLIIHPNNGQSPTSLSIPYETNLSTIPALGENYFTKIGYSFEAWYTTSDFEDGSIVDNLENLTMPNKTLNLYAKWNINQYTITLYTNHSKDNSIYRTITANYGDDISGFHSENPSFEGYNFRGWLQENRTPYTGTYPYLPNNMPSENVTLYAYWEAIDYTITYYVNGVFWDSVTLHFEDEINSINTPIVSGYIFNGWYDESLTQAFTLSYMPSHNIKVYAKMLEKKNITINSEPQTYELSENKGFIINIKLSNFTIEYLVDDKWQSTMPNTKGVYDVRISRFEDAEYNSFNLVIDDGLSIIPNSIELGTYILILYCVAGLEILCAIIIMFLRKQRESYLNYVVILPFGMVSTSQFINFIISLVLAIFGFVLMILQFTKLRKVNIEIEKISTENKPYTPPDVSTNETISDKVEILLKQEGFVDADEDTSLENNLNESEDLNSDEIDWDNDSDNNKNDIQ